MYVESKIPKDLSKYKTKITFGLTIRQLVCVGICIALDALVWLLVFSFIDIDINPKIYITIFLNLPVMAFIIEPEGMKMEVYLKNVVLKSLISPRYRTQIKEMGTPPKRATEQEIKKRKKELPALIKEHPELRAYR